MVALISILSVAAAGAVGESTSESFDTLATEMEDAGDGQAEEELTPKEKWEKAKDDFAAAKKKAKDDKNAAIDSAKDVKNDAIQKAKDEFNEAKQQNLSLIHI